MDLRVLSGDVSCHIRTNDSPFVTHILSLSTLKKTTCSHPPTNGALVHVVQSHLHANVCLATQRINTWELPSPQSREPLVWKKKKSTGSPKLTHWLCEYGWALGHVCLSNLARQPGRYRRLQSKCQSGRLRSSVTWTTCYTESPTGQGYTIRKWIQFSQRFPMISHENWVNFLIA